MPWLLCSALALHQTAPPDPSTGSSCPCWAATPVLSFGTKDWEEFLTRAMPRGEKKPFMQDTSLAQQGVENRGATASIQPPQPCPSRLRGHPPDSQLTRDLQRACTQRHGHRGFTSDTRLASAETQR